MLPQNVWIVTPNVWSRSKTSESCVQTEGRRVSFIYIPMEVQTCRPIKCISLTRGQVKCRLVYLCMPGLKCYMRTYLPVPGRMMPVPYWQAQYAFRWNEILHLWVFLIVGSSYLSVGQNNFKAYYLCHRPLLPLLHDSTPKLKSHSKCVVTVLQPCV